MHFADRYRRKFKSNGIYKYKASIKLPVNCDIIILDVSLDKALDYFLQ